MDELADRISDADLTLLSALTVAACYSLRRRYRPVVTAAITCVVLGFPTFVIYATSFTGGQTVSRASTFAGSITAAGLIVIAFSLAQPFHQIAE